MATLTDLPLKYRAFMRMYPFRRVDWSPGAVLTTPLSDARIAAISSAGYYLLDQAPFDTSRRGGDTSYRVIPHDADLNALRIGNKSDAFDSSGIEAIGGVEAMTRTFDLIVIGSGSAASTVASRCRAAGWTVAMIDKRPFGGTCALRGCDPKKVLVDATAAVDAARRLSGRGVRPNGLAIDWADLMQFKRTFTDAYPEKRKAGL